MSKQLTRKEIEGRIRNELAKKNNSLVEFHRKRAAEYWEKYQDSEKCLRLAKQRLEEAEEEIKQLKDWNERLQEFCNMPDGVREKSIKTYTNETKSREKLSTFLGFDFASLWSFTNHYDQ